MKLFKFVLVAALTAAPALTFAQTTAQEQPKNPVVKREFKREFNQQQRIGNGIRNERFTPRQGARLERQQMRIHRQARTMRAYHNGRLTMKDRRILRHRQNVASRRIFRAKHRDRRNG